MLERSIAISEGVLQISIRPLFYYEGFSGLVTCVELGWTPRLHGRSPRDECFVA